MHDRSSKKRPRNLNLLASEITTVATQGQSDTDEGKNPAAVALGRLGGKKAEGNKLILKGGGAIQVLMQSPHGGMQTPGQNPDGFHQPRMTAGKPKRKSR